MITGYEWQALQTISKCSLESIDLIPAMHHRSNRLISVIRCSRNFKRSKGEAMEHWAFDRRIRIVIVLVPLERVRVIIVRRIEHEMHTAFWIFDHPPSRFHWKYSSIADPTISKTDEDYLYSSISYTLIERKELRKIFLCYINRNTEWKLYFISQIILFLIPSKTLLNNLIAISNK